METRSVKAHHTLCIYKNFAMSNKKYFQDAFVYAHDAMIVIDPVRDHILKANHEACRLLNYSEEDILKQSIRHLFAPSFADLIVFTQSVIEHGKSWSNEITCITGKDNQLILEVSASLYKDEMNEEEQRIILTLRDAQALQRYRDSAEADKLYRHGISKWKTIETVFKEIERKNQLILSAAGEGIYGVNANGEATFINPAAERMLGWHIDDLIGRNVHSVIHHSKADGSHYHNKDCPIYAAIHDGEIHHVDNEVFWRKDGSHFYVEYTSTPIRDNGRLVGAVVLFRDISDRKQAEEKLRKALIEVETLRNKLEQENAYLQEEIRSEHHYKEIIGKSVAINNIIHQIELVAATNANVFITGESGTGKELVARAIHENSGRKNRPLIRVNCASIPRELFESEFFGHVKGAFTGAINDRVGRFELADGGTLFLDEVGEIPLELQGKLLRVLQEQQFERVGDSRTKKVDVRIISATNRDLKKEVETNNFREDLYFRLNVFPIESIALRKRMEDVPLLASHFVQRAAQQFGKSNIKLSVANIQRLQSYSWPGNIRELINVIERSVILSQNGKLVFDLPDNNPNTSISPTPTVQAQQSIFTEHERNHHERTNIINALRITKGKVFGPGGAAELLDVKPTTLSSRIKRLGIDRLKL